MKQIKLIRVDNRLIHAQILLIWLKHFNFNHVIIIDDNLSNDAFLVRIYRLTLPSHITLDIFTNQEMIAFYDSMEKQKYSNIDRILVIIKDINNAYQLHKSGFDFKELQVANINMEHAVSHSIVKTIQNMHSLEIDYFDKCGVKLYLQNSPNDNKTKL